MSSIMAFLAYAVSACFVWLEQLLLSFGGMGIVLSGFVIFLVARFLLTNIVGTISAGSDKVKKLKSKYAAKKGD